MGNDMLHQVHIAAPREQVFKALTTEKGLKGWWTADTEAEPKEGTTALFGFYDRANVFKMHVDELEAPERVEWTCQGDDSEWKDTELHFELNPHEDNETILNFTHAGWRSTDHYFRQCNTTWGALMLRLKQYVESGQSAPFFTH